SMIEAMRFGRIEIAYFGPFSYVLAKSRAPAIEPFAVGIERGSPTYNSVIIATAEGPVKALADIRGRPFGFGDQASTSSHLIPRALLLQRVGLKGGEDYRPVHLGTHDGVARAVQNGQVPAGALSKAILDVLLERGTVDRARLVEVALSDPIPNYPMVMQGNLADPLKAQIRAAFLELRDAEVLRAFRVQGFAPTTDAAYDILRETARVLEMDLSRVRG
ncbi:MAG: phosphate/phosphite/phosphonate ABC transporter substrate-binding protein, partial [Acetobacteraceae bacterium]|nr:phosphate/phosphite/phosphonate ABC transporter substrate-binding protein [Acetobacteraceae bacterium]